MQQSNVIRASRPAGNAPDCNGGLAPAIDDVVSGATPLHVSLTRLPYLKPDKMPRAPFNGDDQDPAGPIYHFMGAEMARHLVQQARAYCSLPVLSKSMSSRNVA